MIPVYNEERTLERLVDRVLAIPYDKKIIPGRRLERRHAEALDRLAAPSGGQGDPAAVSHSARGKTVPSSSTRRRSPTSATSSTNGCAIYNARQRALSSGQPGPLAYLASLFSPELRDNNNWRSTQSKDRGPPTHSIINRR